MNKFNQKDKRCTQKIMDIEKKKIKRTHINAIN